MSLSKSTMLDDAPSLSRFNTNLAIKHINGSLTDNMLEMMTDDVLEGRAFGKIIKIQSTRSDRVFKQYDCITQEQYKAPTNYRDAEVQGYKAGEIHWGVSRAYLLWKKRTDAKRSLLETKWEREGKRLL